MKIKKIIALALSAAMCTAALGTLVACGGGDSNSGGGGGSNNDYEIFEAEYTYLEGIQGGGWSGAGEGTQLIQEDKSDGSLKASNGFYVGYTWAEGFTITFEIMASEATTADLIVRLAIESDKPTLNSGEEFSIIVNDEEHDYGSIKFKNTGSPNGGVGAFEDFAVGKINLNAGENIIKLVVGKTEFPESRKDADGNATDNIAPSFDCIKLKAEKGTLSWIPYEDNI